MEKDSKRDSIEIQKRFYLNLNSYFRIFFESKIISISNEFILKYSHE